jgi:hypothetical protein
MHERNGAIVRTLSKTASVATRGAPDKRGRAARLGL